MNKLKKIDGVEEHAEIIGQVENEIGPIHEVPKKITSLKDTLSNPENFEQMLTNHAQSMEQFTELNTHQAVFRDLQSQFDPERMAKEQAKFLKQQQKYADQLDQYKDKDFQKQQIEEQALKRVKTTTDKLAKHSKEVESAQSKLAKLKKKYSYVPNSNDLSTAVKRNSLEGKSIKDRLILGGTFQVQIAEKSNVDISPLLGYKMNKKWWVGSGFTYRASFGSDVKLSDAFDDQVYGWRVFSEYTAWKSFFAHGEWERMSGVVTDQTTGEAIGRQWSDGLLFGVGKNYNFIKKVKGNVMVLYDFLHNENSVYPKAWVVRFEVATFYRTVSFGRLVLRKSQKPSTQISKIQ